MKKEDIGTIFNCLILVTFIFLAVQIGKSRNNTESIQIETEAAEASELTTKEVNSENNTISSVNDTKGNTGSLGNTTGQDGNTTSDLGNNTGQDGNTTWQDGNSSYQDANSYPNYTDSSMNNPYLNTPYTDNPSINGSAEGQQYSLNLGGLTRRVFVTKIEKDKTEDSLVRYYVGDKEYYEVLNSGILVHKIVEKKDTVIKEVFKDNWNVVEIVSGTKTE